MTSTVQWCNLQGTTVNQKEPENISGVEIRTQIFVFFGKVTIIEAGDFQAKIFWNSFVGNFREDVRNH